MFFKNICLVFLTVLLFGCGSDDDEGGDTDIYKLEVSLEYDSESAPVDISFSPEGDECQSESTYCFEYPSGTEISLTAALSERSLITPRWSIEACQTESKCVVQLTKDSIVTLYLAARIQDRDGDGAADAIDAFPDDPLETVDSDGDGQGDNSDLDRDGDGYSNDHEIQTGSNPDDISGVPVDLDNDFIPDLLDDDRDGDGISNEYEEQLDSDPDDRILTPADLDTDGIPDVLDEDKDGDGVENTQDRFPEDESESSDLDQDGTGDNSDEDIDGDGFSNELEQEIGTSVTDAASQPEDQDGDKIPDSLDDDRDGDGISNIEDDFPDDTDRFLLSAKINIETPLNGFVTSISSVLVSGSIEGPVTEIRIEDQVAIVENGRFTATVTLREGANKITAVGQYESVTGIRATNATKNVILDTTAPEIIISSIREGMVTTSPDITVAGSLDDLRSNLSVNQTPIVTVNGLEVEVIDRSFELSDYSLRPGLNIINVQATDPLGNSKIVQRNVIYLKQAGQKIIELGGNNQAGQVIDTLLEPLSIKLIDRNNLPIANRAATFKVSEGDGSIVSGNSIDRTMTLLSNDQGIIQANYKLGKRSGAGNHQVTVSAIGFPGQVIFSASAQPLFPANLSSARGSAQTGMMGGLLPEPLIARVTDANGNPLQGVDVIFKVEQGGGNFLDSDGNTSVEITSSSDFDGNAIQDFVMGAAIANLGFNTQVVTAQVVGQPELSTTFIASNLRPQAIEHTTISGLVLDNSNQPLPDVEVKIKGNSFNTRETITDSQGKFAFEQAPVGTVHIVLDGSTTSREGEWPHLMFELVTISGQENTVGMPIYFPEVDYEGGKIAGDDKDVIIPMRSVAGAEVIIPANSMTFPDGRTTGRVMFTQVQTDKVPMAAPNGSRFDLAWTLQPSGIHFDPPARVSLPNTFSGSPGEELEMFSFDHDLMEWVSIGPGVVSDDGAKITSRLGHGIRHSGWGGVPPPPDDKCNINCNSTDECVSKSKNANSCSCKSENLDGKVKSSQQPDDCKTLKCGGDEDNDGETPKDTTGEGDCQTTKCEGGSPSSEDDDTDLPDPAKSNDNKCKTCEGGKVVSDDSKGDMFNCSDKTDEGCFVCADGRCEKPDCEASKEVAKKSIGVSNPILTRLQETLDKVSVRNPIFNVSLSGIRSKVETETGEECCGCEEGLDVENYKQTKASTSGNVELAWAAIGYAITLPAEPVGFGIQTSGVLEVGALIVSGKLAVSGSVSGKESKCENNEACGTGDISMSGNVSAGPKLKLQGKLESCDLSYDKCNDVIGLSAEAKASMASSFQGGGQVFIGEDCPDGCGYFKGGELKAITEIEFSVVVGGVYEGSYGTKYEYEVWSEFGSGKCE
jgi:hypothetical protein